MTDDGKSGAPAWHANVGRVLAAAEAAGLKIEIRRFSEGTRTAADAARAVGCDVSQIVKSLVFVAGEEPVLALVSGSDRADPDRLAAALAADGTSAGMPIRRATADEAREASGFAIGGIPPLGHTAAAHRSDRPEPPGSRRGLGRSRSPGRRLRGLP